MKPEQQEPLRKTGTMEWRIPSYAEDLFLEPVETRIDTDGRSVVVVIRWTRDQR